MTGPCLMTTTYLLTATLTGWLNPSPFKCDWKKSAERLSSSPNLKRSNMVLYDDDGVEIKPLTPPLTWPQGRGLQCDWDVLWKVVSDKPIVSEDDIDWENAECMESEGPAFHLC